MQPIWEFAPAHIKIFVILHPNCTKKIKWSSRSRSTMSILYYKQKNRHSSSKYKFEDSPRYSSVYHTTFYFLLSIKLPREYSNWYLWYWLSASWLLNSCALNLSTNTWKFHAIMMQIELSKVYENTRKNSKCLFIQLLFANTLQKCRSRTIFWCRKK